MFGKTLQTKCRKITSKTFISINKPLKIVNIQASQYKNVTPHVQKDIYQTQLQTCLDQIHDRIISLYVPSINDASNDNIDMIVEKNTNPEEDEFYEFPYYTVRIHRWFITIKSNWVDWNIYIRGS